MTDPDVVAELLTRITPTNLLAIGEMEYADHLRPAIVAQGTVTDPATLRIIGAAYAAGYSDGWAKSQGSFLDALLAAGYWVGPL
jgi:hypothetical protein